MQMLLTQIIAIISKQDSLQAYPKAGGIKSFGNLSASSSPGG